MDETAVERQWIGKREEKGSQGKKGVVLTRQREKMGMNYWKREAERKEKINIE